MFQLVYVSSAIVPFTSDELLDLLVKSRDNNARSGLTGMLLYKDGNFMQALEGEEQAVRAVHAKIERDRRHKGLITLLQEPISERRFPEWSMGFRELKSSEVLATPGFSHFLNKFGGARDDSDNLTLSEKLFLSFRKAM